MQIESDAGSELSFVLPKSGTRSFASMFDTLQSVSASVGARSLRLCLSFCLQLGCVADGEPFRRRAARLASRALASP
jgi:hypothetical protein